MYFVDADDDAPGTIRVPVTVTKVHEDGTFDYSGGFVSGSHARGPLLDAAGVPVSPVTALSIQNKAEAQAAWGKLQAAGLLDELESAARKITALIDVMRGNTLLKPVITALEARLDN